jgi:hypothetical protein
MPCADCIIQLITSGFATAKFVEQYVFTFSQPFLFQKLRGKKLIKSSSSSIPNVQSLNGCVSRRTSVRAARGLVKIRSIRSDYIIIPSEALAMHYDWMFKIRRIFSKTFAISGHTYHSNFMHPSHLLLILSIYIYPINR